MTNPSENNKVKLYIKNGFSKTEAEKRLGCKNIGKCRKEKRREEAIEMEKNINAKHLKTIFTGGYDKEKFTVLYGYSEGNML